MEFQITPQTFEDIFERKVSEEYAQKTQDEYDRLMKMEQGQKEDYHHGSIIYSRTPKIDACYFASVFGTGVITQKRYIEDSEINEGRFAYLFVRI